MRLPSSPATAPDRARAVLRVLGVWLTALSLVVVPVSAEARGHGKAHAARKAKKAAKSARGRAAAPAAASPAVALPPAATPAAAVALPRAVTTTVAAAKSAAARPPAVAKPGESRKAAPAVGLPAAATPAVALPRAATATAAAARAPAKPGAARRSAALGLPEGVTAAVALPAVATAVAHAAKPAGAVGLPAAASATAGAAKPHANAAPVATAWALPQVPAEKLRSDLKFESISRLVRANRFPEALVEVDALLEKSPNDDELKVQRARLLFWLDRRESARAYLTPLQQRHPDDPEIRELDAQLKLADGDLPGALAAYRALELAGDGRPELHQRIIDLALELDEGDAVAQSLRHGGHLSDEQEMTHTRMMHPWFSDVAGTWTLHSAVSWWRADAHIGRRFNKRWTALLGGIFEQRYSGADMQRAEAVKGELYFGFSRIDGMIHLEASPNKTFLPVFDGRGDVAFSIIKEFSLGFYGRFADYLTLPTSQTRPSQAWTLAPNVILYVKQWTLQPGYMALHIQGNQTTNTSLFHTGFLKARWEPDPRWMAFAWVFVGTDPTFIERYGINTPVGVSGVIGGEHWWTPRWGTRLSVSRVQPFDSKNDPFTDVTLVLRGRL